MILEQPHQLGEEAVATGNAEDEQEAGHAHGSRIGRLRSRVAFASIRISLADVAKKLGASSRSSYASYEQGRTEPSLSKYIELLAAVAPERALTVGPRSATKKAKSAR